MRELVMKTAGHRTAFIVGMLLLMASLLSMTSEALAATTSAASLASGTMSSSSFTLGGTIYLGSPDGKTYHAKATVSNVESGAASYVEDGADDKCIITLRGMHADQLYISNPGTGTVWKSISIQLEGENVLKEGITVLGDVSGSMSISGVGSGASLRITNADIGISAHGRAYSTTPMELSFSQAAVSIESPATNGVYVTRANIRMYSGSLSVTGVKNSYGACVSTSSSIVGGRCYGGLVKVYDGFSLTCEGATSDVRAVRADYMENPAASLVSIVGELAEGASFVSGGKLYTLVHDGDYLKARPADGATMPRTVTFGYIIYDNVLYKSAQTDKKSVGIGNGKTAKVDGAIYKVINNKKSTAVLRKAPLGKASVALPATVKIKGKKYHLVGISKGAFIGSKAKLLTVKSKKLQKKLVKGCFVGAKKLKTVKVKVGNSKASKTYVKKYRKYFVKSNCGVKVAVR